jgi:hypothetical protein
MHPKAFVLDHGAADRQPMRSAWLRHLDTWLRVAVSYEDPRHAIFSQTPGPGQAVREPRPEQLTRAQGILPAMPSHVLA